MPPLKRDQVLTLNPVIGELSFLIAKHMLLAIDSPLGDSYNESRHEIVTPARLKAWYVRALQGKRQLIFAFAFQRNYSGSSNLPVVSNPEPFAWTNTKGQIILPYGGDITLLKVATVDDLTELDEIKQQRLVQYLRKAAEPGDFDVKQAADTALEALDTLEYRQFFG